jgi:hypothetical protein
MSRPASLLVEVIGLQTPRGRLLFFAAVTFVVFVMPYSALSHLSIWQALHVPSPSIGLTRAYWKLLHGDPVGAWHRNHLIYLVLAVGLPLLARDIVSFRKSL